MQVYADNAATTRMHQTAIDTMTYHLNNTFGNPSSLYTIGQQAKEVLETARADMAACFGAQPREIYFTSGGSEADNQAILSAALPRRAQGQKAHHFDRIRAPRRAAHAPRSSKKRASTVDASPRRPPSAPSRRSR